MNYRLLLTSKAKTELTQNIALWGTERSYEQARRWEQTFWTKTNSIKSNPNSFSLAFEAEEFIQQIREAHFGIRRHPTHRIIFYVHESDVFVIAIRHHAQDWLRQEDLAAE